jgi:hypothetical protein
MISNWVRIVCLALLLVPALGAAASRAWLDRESIRMGETVTLNVETDARVGGEPDFSPLDATFRLMGTSSNTQLSIVNGQQSARTLWAVALEPRQEGVIGIPSLTVGSETTQALTLTVLPMPSGGSSAPGDDVFLEIDAEPADPYVQQQVRYTVRLYYAVTLLEGQLEEPQTGGVQARRLGQDVRYQKTIGERRYEVIERRYALSPEASGRLEIPGPKFEGRALRSGSYGSMFNGGARLSARGNAVAIEVRPRPASAAAPWLPAQSVQLTDESGGTPATLNVGEPLTLTLRLAAQGLAAEQLPELVMPAIDGAEIYPDQETTQTRDDGEWLRGERVRKFAIVPTRPGRLVIPEVAVAWWNASGDVAARATLPARELSVTGAAIATASEAQPAASDADRGAQASTVPDIAMNGSRPWQLATFVLALLWIATLVAFTLRRRSRPVAVADVPAPPPRQSSANWSRALRDAEGRGAAALAALLVEHGRGHDPRVRTLADVAGHLALAEQRDAVLALDAALYGHQDPAIAGAAVVGAFAQLPRWSGASAASRPAGLPDLYPERPTSRS